MPASTAPVADPIGHHRPADFGSVIMAMRLATTAIGLLLASPEIFAGDRYTIGTAVGLIAYAVFRSLQPLNASHGLRCGIELGVEVVLHVVAVGLTGAWSSPFVFSLVTAVSVCGFLRGYWIGLRAGIIGALAVSVPVLVRSGSGIEELKACGTWSAVLVIISIVAGYGRRVSREADRERDMALDRVSRLADANSLLYSLHRVAQTLPQSLDLNDVLDSTVTRLRGLLDFDALIILLFDDTDGHWEVTRVEGCSVASSFTDDGLAIGLRSAIADGGVVSLPSLGFGAVGFDERSGSGMYATLSARGSVIGLIGLEHRESGRFDARSAGLLSGFVPPLSLAMDNARWFARLRTVGADEERTRIARDLHDRIGQSLAYLAFELDRIVSKEQSGEALGDSLTRLRDDVRGVIREVRDTLYDLRTDVSEELGLTAILQQFAERVSDRTSLTIEVDADDEHRLPILQEREMWRIAQEAMTNVERHAKATHISVIWRCDGETAMVQVTDDGCGFEIGRAGRLDSYGMLGMRERASSIGATLDIKSKPGQGTTITCQLTTSHEPTRRDPSLMGHTIKQSPPNTPNRELTPTGGPR